MKQKYVIRVYKEKYSFNKYDDYIYTLPESEVDANDIRIECWADTIEELIAKWYVLINRYEGYTYCVKNAQKDYVIIGGVFDPDDVDCLEEYREG